MNAKDMRTTAAGRLGAEESARHQAAEEIADTGIPAGEQIGPAATKKPSKLLLVLAAMGPGIVTAMAGNDAGGISTYSTAGANFGFGTASPPSPCWRFWWATWPRRSPNSPASPRAWRCSACRSTSRYPWRPWACGCSWWAAPTSACSGCSSGCRWCFSPMWWRRSSRNRTGARRCMTPWCPPLSAT